MSLWPLALGYGIGSVPFAWLLVRRATGLDLRRAGSGNVGATNAFRATRWGTGLLVAMLDVAKGSAAVWAVALAGGDPTARALGGVGAVVGHVFPVWLRFRGGKGVATACGAFAVLAPVPTLLSATLFLVVAASTRLVSLGSLAGACALASGTWFTDTPRATALAALVVVALVIARHRGNIGRLARGTERRLGAPRERARPDHS